MAKPTETGRQTKSRYVNSHTFELIHAVKEIPWKGPHGQELLYTGEVDQDGAPCGSGVAI